MTHARVSAELEANTDQIWTLIGNPMRWPEWDITYQRVPEADKLPSRGDGFVLQHTVANRAMNVSFVLTSLEPNRSLVAEGHGGEGERIEERFTLDPTDGKLTKVTRETVYTLPGQTLGVVATATYAEATVQRSLEQAFARLAHVLGTATEEHADVQPGGVDPRSTDSGPISPEEPYSSNLEDGQRLPQSPNARAPKRPT
jgi:hypothetical protein